MKKGIAILLYVLLMAVFFGFDFFELFNIRQIVFVILGASFLYLPGLFERKKKEREFFFDGDLFGQNALWASLIEFFVLIFSILSGGKKLQYLTPELAFACRPVLYGFCIWLIFRGYRSRKFEYKKKMPDEAEWQDERKNPEGKTQEAIEEAMEQNSGVEGMGRNASEEEKEQKVESLVNTAERLMNLGLTKRETEVALLILKDFSNAEIAAELFISETTVKKHVTNIFGKAGIKARGELKEIIRNL